MGKKCQAEKMFRDGNFQGAIGDLFFPVSDPLFVSQTAQTIDVLFLTDYDATACKVSCGI